ncbi:MAG: hypothetical protein WD824_10180 [Cyclobacteriaceae bacterium]
MKTIGMLSVVVVLSGWMTSYAQVNDPEVPGDHFSLEGALELFKKSSSPEEFEKMLNSRDSKVNNLDLDGDGYIDYIRVHDKYEGNVHAFIIQAVVSERENQDVAVIELEKLANGKAVLQIIGDADIYGIETIIEPTQEVRTYAGTTSNRTVVNVWSWPSVQYVYAPYYDGWSSPWGWYHRPVWYHRWRPIAYVHYYPIWRPYRHYYSVCHSHRVVYAHSIYRPYRSTSVVVRDRHHSQIDRYRSARRDDDRNGRTRDDDRRAYTQNDRPSTRDTNVRQRDNSDLNRRSSIQREEISSPDRSATRQRSVPADIRRTSPNLKREEAPARRSVTVPNNDERRQQVISPATATRTRSTENNEVKQPAYIQRNSSELRREEAPSRRSVTVPSSRETRQQAPAPAVNRNRSESPQVQHSGGGNNNREIRQQLARSSAGDRRASESPSVQQRQSNPSGGSRSAENRRGRQ